MKLSEALNLTQTSIEHVEIRPIDTDTPLEQRELMIGRSKKWLCPTLVVFRNLSRNPKNIPMKDQYATYVDENTREYWNYRDPKWQAYELSQETTQRIFKAGARCIAGTDCLGPYVLAGFSLHEELEEMVKAGLSEFEVLKASTVNAAEFLKKQNEMGTIESGKVADLVLLNGNPRMDISNTRKIAGVMVKGKWLDANDLSNMLSDVRAFHSK
jgi:hypothetical protein